MLFRSISFNSTKSFERARAVVTLLHITKLPYPRPSVRIHRNGKIVNARAGGLNNYGLYCARAIVAYNESWV